MKTLDDLAGSVNPALLVTGALALVLLLFGFFVLLKTVIVKSKDKKLRSHPRLLDISYVGSYFKVLNVDTEKSIVQLGVNPDRQYPYGKDKAWFQIGLIPKNLLVENFVIKVEGTHDRQINYIAGPIF